MSRPFLFAICRTTSLKSGLTQSDSYAARSAASTPYLISLPRNRRSPSSGTPHDCSRPPTRRVVSGRICCAGGSCGKCHSVSPRSNRTALIAIFAPSPRIARSPPCGYWPILPARPPRRMRSCGRRNATNAIVRVIADTSAASQKGPIMPLVILIAVLVVVTLFFLFLAFSGAFVNIGGQQVGIIERRFVGRPLPEARVVAMRGEIGIQARVLQPGLHVLAPFLYKVRKDDMIVVAEDEVGLLESIDGEPLPAGHIFGRHVDLHDTYQDGEGFLRNGGQKGPQVDTLPPGKYRVNTYLFRITTQPALIVAQGQVGVVSARDGEPMGSGRLLARKVEGHNAFQDGEAFVAHGGQRGPQIEVILPGRYRINTDLFNVEVQPATIVHANQVGLVTAKDGAPLPEAELVAAHVEAHSDFQDASAFLASGGERGPQYDLLKPGTYYINPLMFDVKLDDVAVVQRGEVAVLVSNVGKEPEPLSQQDRLSEARERYVVPAGYRGIQAEVAGPGVYYLNRWAYIAYIIPTTNLTIDWADEDISDNNDSRPSATGPVQRAQLFNPLAVTSRAGCAMPASV